MLVVGGYVFAENNFSSGMRFVEFKIEIFRFQD